MTVVLLSLGLLILSLAFCVHLLGHHARRDSNTGPREDQ
jgi:hypothetical protein